MSKVTVITDRAGKVVAIGHGHLSEKSARGQATGGLRAGPDQQLHEIDVPENVEHIQSWAQLLDKVQPHLKRLH
jgi:hypothetical protein